MLFPDHLAIVRGGGDLGTGVVLRLSRAGLPVIVLELAQPMAIRRAVAMATAVEEGRTTVEGLDVVRVGSADEARGIAAGGRIPVMISSSLPDLQAAPSIVIDARMAKRNIDTRIDDAPLVVGLGPGFLPGRDCHAVVETKRGHDLGRVLRARGASPDTGVPGDVGGESADRVVRAPSDGQLAWSVDIGDTVARGDVLGSVGASAVVAAIPGVVRGLLPPGRSVTVGLKIGDVDPRGNRAACFEVSDKSLAIGGGALEAVMTWLDGRAP